MNPQIQKQMNSNTDKKQDNRSSSWDDLATCLVNPNNYFKELSQLVDQQISSNSNKYTFQRVAGVADEITQLLFI